MIIVGIPYYESDSGKREVLNRCINSLRGQDQIIVLAGKQPTLAKAINMLFEMGFGMGAEFMIICNDDVILNTGDLSQLCKENIVCSPLVNGEVNKLFHAHMFGIPREVYRKVGPQFEGYDGFYFDDSDYWMKIEQAGFKIETVSEVNILHPEPGRTLRTYGDNQQRVDKNREIFLERWGKENLERVERIY